MKKHLEYISVDGSCVKINFNKLFLDFKGLEVVILLFVVMCSQCFVALKIKFCNWKKNSTGKYNLIVQSILLS